MNRRPSLSAAAPALRAWHALAIRNVAKSYRDTRGDIYCALGGVSARIEAGSFYCLLGPSGCGKSTLLNLIAGFEHCTEGELAFLAETGRVMGGITGPGADRAVVFQDVNMALFPWLSVEENVGLGRKFQGEKRSEYKNAVDAYLTMVGLSEHAHKFPFELSGGMRQRVQLARALIMGPDILLMDEPFAALDAITKRSLQNELARIWSKTEKTIVYVTHDIVEALLLGTHVAVMTAGPSATIKSEIKIDLPSPRSHTDMKFVDLLKDLEDMLMEEIPESVSRRSC